LGAKKVRNERFEVDQIKKIGRAQSTEIVEDVWEKFVWER
jgi:hypothetical protein